MHATNGAGPASAVTEGEARDSDLLGGEIGSEATSPKAAIQAAASSGFANYVLAELRCARLQAQLMVNEIQAMKIALGAGFIDFDNAIEHLAEVGVLDLVIPSSVPLP